MKMQEITERRSVEQNRCLWALLTDLANQVKWPVDGELVYMTPEDWKYVTSAALRKYQRVAKGIEGGFVMLGASTSKMTKGEMVELIELVLAFGTQHDVKWTENDPPTTAPL